MDARTNDTAPGQAPGRPREDAHEPQSLTEVLDAIAGLADDRDTVSIHDVREEIGERSFGPFLLVPAVIEISPIGGIPGLPTAIAVVIALFAVQILIGRKHLWLPGFVERRTIGAGKLGKAMEKLRPVARVTDRLFKPRLKWLTKPPWLQGMAALCIALCFTVPPLELIPFASTAPMGTIALFGLSLVARDGLIANLAALTSLAAIYLVSTVVFGG
ncbi:exopolysaccharide biosynthesis protein [Rhizobium sp. SGZ-381]|uniref:exopolysaccharide biosynthesis protein n=1 Tax=Rhizobium sp. SGZ-381 TaxID=3342800 RepID=UPI00366E3354